MDHRLINLLVCPLCKGPLEMVRDADQLPAGLSCRADRLVFPIRDGIPVMLESEASALPDEAVPAAPELPGAAA
jgi:uncharacterized protein YbaR (Trm112 family)